MAERESQSKKYQSGVRISLPALILGSGASFAFATRWLKVSPGWLAFLLGAVFSIVGAFLGENVGDAIMFSAIVGTIVTVFFIIGPEIAILRAEIIPVATGLCIGKLVVGISKEVSI
jgi:hypothetical protein